MGTHEALNDSNTENKLRNLQIRILQVCQCGPISRRKRDENQEAYVLCIYTGSPRTMNTRDLCASSPRLAVSCYRLIICLYSSFRNLLYSVGGYMKGWYYFHRSHASDGPQSERGKNRAPKSMFALSSLVSLRYASSLLGSTTAARILNKGHGHGDAPVNLGPWSSIVWDNGPNLTVVSKDPGNLMKW